MRSPDDTRRAPARVSSGCRCAARGGQDGSWLRCRVDPDDGLPDDYTLRV
jgi:hypothetical protein